MKGILSILLKIFLLILLIAISLFVINNNQNRHKKTEEPSITAQEFSKLNAIEQFKLLTHISEQNGAEAAWHFLVTASKSMTSNPHDLAHSVGALIWQKKGISGMAICDPSFAFGCYHGYTEEALKNDLDKLPSLAKSCDQVGTIDSGPWSSCIHGLGHGVASYFRTTDLRAALQACNILSIGKNYCHDGVFMEFTINAPKAFYQDYLSKNQLYPCTTLDKEYQSTCGRNQPYILSKYDRKTIPQIAAICSKANDEIKTSCINTLGLIAAERTNGDIKKIKTICNQVEETNSKIQCYISAATEIIFQQYSDWQSNAPSLCTELKGEALIRCNQSINYTIQNYHRK